MFFICNVAAKVQTFLNRITIQRRSMHVLADHDRTNLNGSV